MLCVRWAHQALEISLPRGTTMPGCTVAETNHGGLSGKSEFERGLLSGGGRKEHVLASWPHFSSCNRDPEKRALMFESQGVNVGNDVHLCSTG